jgi:hypothetical protein
MHQVEGCTEAGEGRTGMRSKLWQAFWIGSEQLKQDGVLLTVGTVEAEL